MSKFFKLCLLATMLVFSVLISACGSSSEKFIGTWEATEVGQGSMMSTEDKVYTFITINKEKDIYTLTEYRINDGSNNKGWVKGIRSFKNDMVGKVEKDTLYVANGQMPFIITDNGLLKDMTKNKTYKKKSDKVLPFKEFNPVQGAPEPK